MAYEKHVWECDEVITADKLNHMEDGIANSGGGVTPLILTYTAEAVACGDGGTKTVRTYNHSWQEIYDALGNGVPVYLKEQGNTEYGAGSSLIPILEAGTNYTAYTVYDVLNAMYDFADANSLVWEGECGDK